MRLVSFSLYGAERKYIEGAIINARFIAENMPGWTPLFYVGNDVESHVVSILKSYESIIRRCQPDWHSNGMFWRFRVFCDFNPDYALIRDTDSRITLRELNAIEEWVQSNKMFHIMRDHPFHNAQILGGMWGGTSEVTKFLSIDKFTQGYSNLRGQDQQFLSDYLYPLVRKDSMIHDSFFWINLKRKKFRTLRADGQYVGESVDSDGSVDLRLREFVLSHENSFCMRLKLNFRYFKEKSVLTSWLKKCSGFFRL